MSNNFCDQYCFLPLLLAKFNSTPRGYRILRCQCISQEWAQDAALRTLQSLKWGKSNKLFLFSHLLIANIQCGRSWSFVNFKTIPRTHMLIWYKQMKNHLLGCNSVLMNLEQHHMLKVTRLGNHYLYCVLRIRQGAIPQKNTMLLYWRQNPKFL